MTNDYTRGVKIPRTWGVKIQRAPTPYVHFYTTKRVGGGARDLRAVKFLKFSAS